MLSVFFLLVFLLEVTVSNASGATDAIFKGTLDVHSLVLLSTIYDSSHENKLKSMNHILKRNLELFDEIHLLVQEDYSKERWVELFPVVADESIHLVHVATPEFHRNKAWRHFNSSAYLYQDFFKYANDHLSDKLVVLTNNDIEFPPYAPDMFIEFWQPDTGLVVTRQEAPCGGKSQTPNQFCKWGNIPKSYDVFVFKPPLLQDVIDQTNFPQNFKGAENSAAFVLHNAGKLEMYNLCEYMDVWHHHCHRNWTAFLELPHLCKIYTPYKKTCWNPAKIQQSKTVSKRGGENYVDSMKL